MIPVSATTSDKHGVKQMSIERKSSKLRPLGGAASTPRCHGFLITTMIYWMRTWARCLPRRLTPVRGRSAREARERRHRLMGKRMSKHLNLEHKLMIYQECGAAAGVKNHISY